MFRVPEELEKGPTSKKFGTWDGVFARVMLNVLGVVYLLRTVNNFVCSPI